MADPIKEASKYFRVTYKYSSLPPQKLIVTIDAESGRVTALLEARPGKWVPLQVTPLPPGDSVPPHFPLTPKIE